MKFNLNDRVMRPENVFKDGSPLRRGQIISIYCEKVPKDFLVDQSKNIWDTELYRVLWDSGKEEEGFFPHGLSFESGENSSYISPPPYEGLPDVIQYDV